MQRQIGELVSSFSNEEVLMGRVLESAALKQVVSAVGGLSESKHVSADEGYLSATSSVAPRLSEEDGSDPGALLSKLDDLIGSSYGRDIAKNDLANVPICLTQGYITTLAGLPGTGKTSLVNILAEVLGLKNAASKRFVEVPVEKGWTSYKDFIGYYNPFSESLEKSNPVAIRNGRDSMCWLSRLTQHASSTVSAMRNICSILSSCTSVTCRSCSTSSHSGTPGTSSLNWWALSRSMDSKKLRKHSG